MDFSQGDMSSTDFRYVDLSFSNLSGVYAEPTTCDGYISNSGSEPSPPYNGTIWDRTMFLHSDLSDVVANNMYATSIAFAFSTLDDADFTGSDFSNDSYYMDFDEDLGNGSLFDMNSAIGTIFDNVYFTAASFYQNNFTSASFIDSILVGSEIMMNDFTDVDFTYADLSNGTGYENIWDGADFSYADLTDSDFDFSGSTGITWYFTTCSDGSNTGTSGSC